MTESGRGYVLTSPAAIMLSERGINEDWGWARIESPDNVQELEDGTTHYTKSFAENQMRILRVIVNASVEPKRIVTVFFDRRLGRTK